MNLFKLNLMFSNVSAGDYYVEMGTFTNPYDTLIYYNVTAVQVPCPWDSFEPNNVDDYLDITNLFVMQEFGTYTATV